MQVDLREFRAAYLAEVDEHLSAINGLLIAVETASRNHKPSPRDLRELMRLLHTIKGLSGMVGVEPIVTIAHSMETVLRTADRAGGLLGDRTLEALIGATRAIEARVRAVANGEPVTDPAPATLAALEAIDVPEQQPSLPTKRSTPRSPPSSRHPSASSSRRAPRRGGAAFGSTSRPRRRRPSEATPSPRFASGSRSRRDRPRAADRDAAA